MVNKSFSTALRKSKPYILGEIFLFGLIFWVFTFLYPSSATPFLVFMAFISLKLRKLKWRDIGFVKPPKIRKTILITLALGVGFAIFSNFLMDPFLEEITGTKIDLSQFSNLPGNPVMLLIWLAIAWSLAAFGEEIADRGYLMERVAKLIGGNKSWWLSLIIVSLIFGLAHSYQGITGMITTGLSGAFFGATYLLSKRNLWVPILVHGFFDTAGFLFIYFGLMAT